MKRVGGAAPGRLVASLTIAAVAIALGLGVAVPPSGAQEDPPRAEPQAETPQAAPAPEAEAAPAPKPDAPKRSTASKPPATPAPPPAPPSEQAWVRGEVRVNFRANASPTSAPVGVAKTGDRVGVFERRGEWARIQLGDAVGWLPTSFLDPQPPPLEHVAQLEAQVADLQAKLDAALREAGEHREHIEQLSTVDAERGEAMRRLSEENRDLRAGERWPYLVTGAGILGIGLAVGLLVRGGTRRSSARIRF
jgi:uncharacterized protein YgiM (DUF1202 family)